jgi:hypothetical protein
MGHDAGARARRPLRRLLYRELRFAALDDAQLQILFEAFACAVRLHAKILYWVHSLGEAEYVILGFRHASMLPYCGLEVVQLGPDDISYYRLPGAKAGGRGQVRPGVYPISIQAPKRRPHYLRIRKCQFGQLHLDEVCDEPAEGQHRFEQLERHKLDRSKFADEMRTLVDRCLEWDYQRALLGESSLLRDAEREELRRMCGGVSARTDACLDELARRGWEGEP